MDSEDQPHAGAPPLARRADIALGGATVRPSLRSLDGPLGSATAEPRVMQVLLAFIDAGDAVLTRDDLMRQCWPGMVVGDDSVNRAVAEVRRLARTTGAGFTIETIPRVGYRLAVEVPSGDIAPAAPPPAAPKLTRRWLIAGGAGAAALGLAGWLGIAARNRAHAASLVTRARDALLFETPESDAQALPLLAEATRLRPDDATAWGMLSFAHATIIDYAAPDRVATHMRASEAAGRRALRLDPAEPHARLTHVVIRYQLDGWYARERQLRAILRDAPDNVFAMMSLFQLLQAAGRARESLEWTEKALAQAPMGPGVHARKGLKLWILGRPSEADLLLSRAMQLWPRHPLVWNARLVTLAFTGRSSAALALFASDAVMPPGLAKGPQTLWRTSLPALETRDPAGIARARETCLAIAGNSPGASGSAIMILSALGQLDAAYAVAGRFLLDRGTPVHQPQPGGTLWNDPRWRRTQWLFTPAAAAFRADPRYPAFCEALGLTRYWRETGVGPDRLS